MAVCLMDVSNVSNRFRRRSIWRVRFSKLNLLLRINFSLSGCTSIKSGNELIHVSNLAHFAIMLFFQLLHHYTAEWLIYTSDTADLAVFYVIDGGRTKPDALCFPSGSLTFKTVHIRHFKSTDQNQSVLGSNLWLSPAFILLFLSLFLFLLQQNEETNFFLWQTSKSVKFSQLTKRKKNVCLSWNKKHTHFLKKL